MSDGPAGRVPTVVHVVVPARNEAQFLPACLAALSEARIRLRRSFPRVLLRTTVVLDGCTDDSASVVRRDAQVRCLEIAGGSAGAARAAGVAQARSLAADVDPGLVWLANTDADSVVPPEWLVSQVRLASRGVDLVTGAVVPNPADLTEPLLRAWRRNHHLGDGHSHVYGANLGLTLATYDRAGGFPDVPVGEDARLVAAVRRTGAACWASGAQAVVTSGRSHGRAPDGFAGYLARLTHELATLGEMSAT